MPTKKFWAYVRMLSVLQARETIREINAFAFVMGSMSKEKSQEFEFNLQAQAVLQDLGPRAYRPKSLEEMMGLTGGTTKIIMGQGPQVKAKASSTTSTTSINVDTGGSK